MKENEIRKRDVLNRYLELVRTDAERIFSDKSDFEHVPCPACGNEDHKAEFEKSGFFYVKCTKCDTLFVNPRPTHHSLMRIYNDSASSKFWVQDFFMPMAEARREKMFKPRVGHIIRSFEGLHTGIIGDIGSGFGIFLEELRKQWPNASVVAIEPSTDMAAICRNKGIRVVEAPIEDLDSSTYEFDLLTAFELLEHLREPLIFGEKAFELLRPNGYLYFTTLNGLGFDIQLLWENSKSVTPPHHLNFFNPYSIRLMLEKIGFRVIEVSTPGQLDWDIVEGGYLAESLDPGRFFRTVSRHGSAQSKKDLQSWISSNNFSSHMRVIAQKN